MKASVFRLMTLAALVIVCFVPTASSAADAAALLPMAESKATGPSIPPGLTPDEARDLVARMPDADVRAALIGQLDAAARSRTGSGGPPVLEALGGQAGDLRESLRRVLRTAPELSGLPVRIVERLTDGRDASWLLVIALFTMVIVGVGFLGEWLFARYFLRNFSLMSGKVPTSLAGRCVLCLFGSVLDVLRVIVFGAAAMGVYLALYQGHEPTRALVTAVVVGVMLFRFLGLVLQTLLSPSTPEIRVFPLNDAMASSVTKGAKVIGGIVIAGTLGVSILEQLGIEPELVLLVIILVSMVMASLGIFVVWRLRDPVATVIRSGDDVGRVREALAAHWHILVSAYLVVTWAMTTVQRLITGDMVLGPPFATIAMLVALPAVDRLMLHVIARFFPSPSGPLKEDEGGIATPSGIVDALPFSDPYFRVIVRNSRVLLAAFAILVLARIWGIDLQAIVASGLGQTVAGSLFTVIVTLVLGSAVWGIIKTAIAHQLPEVGQSDDEMEGGEGMGTGGTRTETLLPLFRNFFLITLVIVVGLVVLSAIGVDIGPLLAGAGMLGIAVGFGAQTLVRDIFSGVFFLIDDAFRVGEYIVIGEVRGMVEKISIRSLRLRHHNGPVHTIPFGEIKHMTNFSRDWVIMKLEVRVPFETDIEKVRKIIKKIGVSLMEDPVHGPNFLQPLKSQGVNRMDDSAFIIRVKFMAKPGEQFVLRREVFRRIQEAFQEQGIKFAPRRVIVDTTQGVSPAIAAAAEEAVAKSEEVAPRGEDTM